MAQSQPDKGIVSYDFLRDYQLRDYNLIEEAFNSYNRVLYQLPTGGGKSLVIAQKIIDNKKKRILFLSHKREIITQMRKRLGGLNIPTGFVMAQEEDNLECNIIIASISTVTRDKRIEQILNQSFDIIIIDEAHRTVTPSYEKVLDHLFELNPKTQLLGVTATPYRLDKKPLKKYYEELIISDDVDTLVNNGWLASHITYSTNIGDIDSEVEKSGDDYKTAPLSAYMRKQIYLDYLVDIYEKRGEGKQMLVFCVDKAHAKSVLENYKKRGYKSIAYIDSDTSLHEREKILSDYDKGLIQIIVCIETLTEGVDLPETKVVQLARPTKSLILHSQMLGRGSRIKKDGSKLIILDCAGNTQSHGLINSPRQWSLNPLIDPANPAKKNKIVGRREDGTYTEDPEELDYLELEELDPIEYFSKISNNLESSEKFNLGINNQRYQILEDIGNLFKKTLKPKMKIYFMIYGEKPKHNSNLYLTQLRISLYENVESDNFIKIESNTKPLKYYPYYSSYGYNSPKLEMNVLLGEMSRLLLDKVFNEKLMDLIQEFEKLDENKIDINLISTTVDIFKKEQFSLELDEIIKSNPVLKLPELYLPSGVLFSKGWGAVTQIEFHKSKISKTSNHISIIKSKSDHIFTNDKVKYEWVENLLFKKWDEIKKLNNL